jgi:hypothetical protein
LFTPEKVDKGVTKTKDLPTINNVTFRDPKVPQAFVESIWLEVVATYKLTFAKATESLPKDFYL